MRHAAFVASLAILLGAAPNDAPPEKLKILLTYGGHGFQQKQFFAMFDALDGVTYDKALLPKDAGRLKPGLEKEYDVIVRYDMVNKFTPEQRKDLEALLEKGIGLVSLHHNLGAHRDWDGYRKIIGGKFIFKPCELDGKSYTKSGWAHGQDMKISVIDKDHPITQGVEDFEIHDETYNNYYVDPKAKILLKTDHPKNEPRVAWVREFGKSRVFFFMLGHDAKAWENPAYPKILLQGIRWAAGK
jgi:type 1 glutamine amidotransferase